MNFVEGKRNTDWRQRVLAADRVLQSSWNRSQLSSNFHHGDTEDNRVGEARCRFPIFGLRQLRCHYTLSPPCTLCLRGELIFLRKKNADQQSRRTRLWPDGLRDCASHSAGRL